MLNHLKMLKITKISRIEWKIYLKGKLKYNIEQKIFRIEKIQV